MATDLYSLQERLDSELGMGNVPAPQLRSLLRNAVPKYNGHVSYAFTPTLSGSGDTETAVLDRDATDDELELLSLIAVTLYLDGEAVRWSFGALKISNVSGKSDASGIEFALAKRRKELWDPDAGQIPKLIARVNDRAIMGEVSAAELGETLDVATASTSLTLGDTSLGILPV